MQQYYIGKEQSEIEILSSNTELENKIFINDGLDKEIEYNNISCSRITFSKISFNNIKITKSLFNHCVFIGCYFNKSTLQHIDFKNCTFIECEFNSMNISNCNFFYTNWKSTYIKFNELKKSLPSKHNHRSRLCKVMAQNCINDGNIAEYKKYFLESIKAREEQYLSIILRNEGFYSQNYTQIDSIKNIFKLFKSKFSGYAWGHGESITKILLSSIFNVIIFAHIYLYSEVISNLSSGRFINALYVSFCNFLTISSDITFSENFFRYITIIEGFTGIIFAGLFVTVLFKKINTR